MSQSRRASGNVVGYRLQMSVLGRAWRTTLNVVLGMLFAQGLVDGTLSFTLRAGCALGVGLSLLVLRVVLGPAVVVRPEGLRVYTMWPRRKDVAWYRVYAVDVRPDQWTLDLELNSGERITLPAVERVDVLYEQIEELRQRLDA